MRMCCGLVLLCLFCITGCASFPTFQKKDASAEKKVTRKAETLLHEQRDRADYESTLTRWQQQNDAEGCQADLEKLLQRSPEHCDARLLMVEILLASDDPQTANAHAKAALDARPTDARAHFAMAITLDALGKHADALRYYEQASKIDPKNESFAVAYQSAVQAQRANVAGVPGTANAPMDPPATFAVATDAPAGAGEPVKCASYSDCAGDTNAAEANSPQAVVSAATRLIRAGQPLQAVEILLPATRTFPNSAAVFRALGAAYYLSGDCQSSQVALQQALSLDKSSALSYLLMGRALTGLGEREAAESCFRQAVALDPRYAGAR